MTSATPFDPPQRPAPFAGGGPGLGPADDDPCPCGSTRSTVDCHFNPRTHRWQLPAFTPLLTDARTGSSVHGCFAAFTNDCKGKLSNEQWLSRGILVEAGDGKVVRIGGLPWQPQGRVDKLPPRRLGSKMLCERHNRALSPLDAAASYASRYWISFIWTRSVATTLTGANST